ncbi:hypothetical protein SBOR_5970 [Sclerotinia borealis F-4128]|uniref:Uncharacterized protein n=1 Tax=Sclerotinia borealis (strain F-4128) TaxID=1432307 RepID=W9CGI0_SCLBF|nr:hypothetical protein SBOR_5970 [Sclerotinia borealis F-4128]
MSSSYPTSYSPNFPIDNNVTAETYNFGNTMLCQSAVSTYISAIDSWTTFTPATCSHNNSPTASTNPSSALTITSTGFATLQETSLSDASVSTVTKFSSTGTTTTITGSLSTNSQTSSAPKEVLVPGLSGISGLGWILYFSYKLLH